jgi:hypothetical protein
MLREQTDIDNSNKLIASLNKWMSNTDNTYKQTNIGKETGSLYRYGWFYINDHKYSISGWQFRDGIVTFENEKTGEKIKYSIDNADVVNKKTFTKDDWLTKITNRLRFKISIWLREISDILQP